MVSGLLNPGGYKVMGENEVFGSAPGLPAVEHAKKRAKQKRQSVTAKTFYTLKGGVKIVMLTVKSNGCYSSYFGNTKKLGADIVSLKLKEWKQKGQWLEPHEAEQKVSDTIKQLQRG